MHNSHIITRANHKLKHFQMDHSPYMGLHNEVEYRINFLMWLSSCVNITDKMKLACYPTLSLRQYTKKLQSRAPPRTKQIRIGTNFRYCTNHFRTSLFYKGPLLFADFATNELLSCSILSFKNCTKRLLTNIQSSGDLEEWQTENFKLYNIPGLRRSNRNIAN